MSWRPSSISTSQRSAISSVDCERLGPLGERLRHLLAGAQVELVRLEGHLRRGERRLRLHAQQRRVVVVVLAAQVVHVAGADERAADLAGDPDDALVGLVLRGDAVLLDLEVDVLGAERLEQVVGVRARLGVAAVDEAQAEARGEAAGERDHALGVRARAGPGRPSACRGAGPRGSPAERELDEVAVAGVGRRRAASGGCARPSRRRAVRVVVDEVDLAADDRLDAVLAGTPCRARPRRSSRRGRSGRGRAGRTPRRARRARRSCTRRRAASTRSGRADGRRTTVLTGRPQD